MSAYTDEKKANVLTEQFASTFQGKVDNTYKSHIKMVNKT